MKTPILVLIGLIVLSPVAPAFAATTDVLPPPPAVPTETPKVTEVLVRMKTSEEAVRVSVPENESAEDVARTLAQQSDVLYAEPNNMVRALGIPNDPLFANQWNLDSSAHGIHAEGAWAYTQGEGVVVAVVDSGVAYRTFTDTDGTRYTRAPDFESTTFVQGYDFVHDDMTPADDYGHGTHIAGTIAQGTNNGQGTAGVAPKAKIMPVKVLDENGWGSYADIADGIRYAADNGAQVINLSLGGNEPSQYLAEAVRYAYNKGCIIVAASGNDSAQKLNYPAAYTSYVIAVGATRYDGTRPAYANYSNFLDVVAPGGDNSVDQNKDGTPDGIVQQTFSPTDHNSFGYYPYRGTSMATAHVSGVVALMLAQNGRMNTYQVRMALRSTATDVGPRGRDAETGYGIVNAEEALWYGKTKPSTSTTGTTPSTPGTGTTPSGTYSVSAPVSAQAGSTVTFTWTTPVNHPYRSWIGFYKKGAAGSQPIRWERISDSATMGTYRVTAPAAGAYEVRLYKGATYQMVASQGMTVEGGQTPTDSSYTVTGDTSPAAGSTVTFTWTTPVNHPYRSWIGFYKKGAAGSQPIRWERISDSATTGTYRVTAPAAGAYEVRLYKGATYQQVAALAVQAK